MSKDNQKNTEQFLLRLCFYNFEGGGKVVKRYKKLKMYLTFLLAAKLNCLCVVHKR